MNPLQPFEVAEQQQQRVVAGQHWIDGRWVGGARSAGQASIRSTTPCERALIWEGEAADRAVVEQAVAAARTAWKVWHRRDLEDRIHVVKAFQAIVLEHAESLALLIARETGKPLWEAKTEAASVAGKVDLSIAALKQRRDTSVEQTTGERVVTRFKPHGVLAVLGPFNFPAHLPNGHIVPALLAGNTLVFKPSELTPAVGQWMAAAWELAGLPAGVLNLVHGSRETGAALLEHPQIDGLLFTGSSQAGKHFHQQFGGMPQKILALEMGGNNPLVLSQVQDVDAAVYQIVLSAYLTAGQRCTCARRLILIDQPKADRILDRLTEKTRALSIGWYDQQPEPFMGSVISKDSGRNVHRFWEQLVAAGGQPRLTPQSIDDHPALLTPGLIELSPSAPVPDEECFGPLLQVYRVGDWDQAIELANRTQYGLSAGLLADDPSDWERFISEIRAGVVNWNRQTTGASGKLPFGGCGLSGNHRPSGYYAADYCSFPVASLESEHLALPAAQMPGMNW